MAEKLNIDEAAMLSDFDSAPAASAQEGHSRRPGRPPKDGKKAQLRVTSYLTPEQYKKLEEVAASQGRSLSKQVAFEVEQAYRRMKEGQK